MFALFSDRISGAPSRPRYPRSEDNLGSTADADLALVIFDSDTDINWLHGLRRGYRHCFAIFSIGRNWVILDPVLNYARICAFQVRPDYDLVTHYRLLGYRVLETHVRRPRGKIAPILPATCVEIVKRALGIHAWHVVTPYALYNYLVKENMRNIKGEKS
ncbi:MAG: hypothetical protein FJX46_00280 [Alphaproteobacteria bacterium]|nr:hypothetical protein [Alphaproteobacteria bacterium]